MKRCIIIRKLFKIFYQFEVDIFLGERIHSFHQFLLIVLVLLNLKRWIIPKRDDWLLNKDGRVVERIEVVVRIEHVLVVH